MSKVAIGAAAVLGFLFLAVLWGVGNYNSLVTSRNQVEKSWSMVETQYQRRFDLIGNLVESVKGGQKQELEVLTKIADARKAYSSAGSINDKATAASQIETNVALLPRLQEAYPELKSNQLVQSLMTDLKGTEDGIVKARDTFNVTATNYNTNIQRFPKNLFAKSYGFEKQNLFKSDTEAAKATQVKF